MQGTASISCWRIWCEHLPRWERLEDVRRVVDRLRGDGSEDVVPPEFLAVWDVFTGYRDERLPMSRYPAAPTLARLKDFQRRTVDYVFNRLYGANSTNRFLVADEVGLCEDHGGAGSHRQECSNIWMGRSSESTWSTCAQMPPSRTRTSRD